MTEPPEPRRPEEGGGEDQDPELRGYEIEDEEMDPGEWMDLLEEDAALDALHNLDPSEVGGDLANIVEILKDSVDAADIPMKNTGRAERGEAVVPPRSTKGAAPSMMSESIAILNQVANDNSAAGALQEAQSAVDNNVVAGLMQAVERLAELAGQARQATEGNEGDAGEVGSTSEHAANAIEEAIEAAQVCAQAIDLAIQHEATFRQTAGSIAQKHAG